MYWVILSDNLDLNETCESVTNFMMYNKFEVGGSYRINDSFGAMVNFAINPNLRIGYAYDYIISDLNVTTQASHEIMLLFDLNIPKKASISPRYF